MERIARLRRQHHRPASNDNRFFCLQLRDTLRATSPRRSRTIRPIRAVIPSIRVPKSEEAHHAAVRLGAIAADQSGLDETTARVKKLHQYQNAVT